MLDLFCLSTHFSLEVNEDSSFTKRSIPMNVFCISCHEKGIVFIGTFYGLESLYSALEPWISWSCWIFSPWPSNLGLMFDSFLVITFCMEDSVLCFSVKSGASNKQIFTKCLLWTRKCWIKKKNYTFFKCVKFYI